MLTGHAKMKTLNLTLKKKFFDMIASGEKTEEYREIKQYWAKRFLSGFKDPYPAFELDDLLKTHPRSNGKTVLDLLKNDFDTITFKNGYARNAPTIVIECLGITIGKAKPEWSDNWPGDVFIIKLGKILETRNQRFIAVK